MQFNSPSPSQVPQQKLCPICGREEHLGVDVCPFGGVDGEKLFKTEPQFADKYKFLGVIGSGGMGVIYKARMLALGKDIAVKMMHAHLLTADAVARFKVEAQATGMLSHKNIVRIHDYGTTSTGQPFMVMDYVDGETLADVLKVERSLSSRRFLRLFIQTCDALSHAHQRNVLHRDIKPSNIMLTRNDDNEEEIRIMDFGVAKLTSDMAANQLTKTGDAVGSPLYMSPEQSRGKPDARSDLYSLGCVMYEVLTGVPPFVGSNALDTMLMHLNDAPKPMREVAPNNNIDSRLELVVQRLLQKDPASRQQSMEELQSDLEVVQSPPVVTKKLPAAKQTRKLQTRQLPTRWVVVGGLTVVLIGLIIFFLFHDTQYKSAKIIEKASNERPEDVIRSSPIMDAFNLESSSAIAARIKDKQEPFEVHRYLSISNANADVITKDDLKPLEDPSANYIRNIEFQGLNINDNALECISNIPLENLDLEKTKVADLHAIKNIKTLKFINLNSTKLNSQGYKVLSQLTNLNRMQLFKSNISGDELRTFYRMHKLDFLDTRGCIRLMAKDVTQLQNALPRCQINFLISNDEQTASIKALLEKIETERNIGPEDLIRNDRLILADMKKNHKASDDARVLMLRHLLSLQIASSYFSQAFDTASEMVALIEKNHPNTLLFAKSLIDLGLVDILQKKLSEGLRLNDKAVGVIEHIMASTKDPDVKYECNELLVQKLKELGDLTLQSKIPLKERLSKALSYYQRAEQQMTSANSNLLFQGDLYNAVASICLVMKNRAAADKYYNKAEHAFNALLALPSAERLKIAKQPDIFLRQAGIAQGKGEIAKEIHWRNKFIDRLENREKANEMRPMRKRVGLSKDDQDVLVQQAARLTQLYKLQPPKDKSRPEQISFRVLNLLRNADHPSAQLIADVQLRLGYYYLQDAGRLRDALKQFELVKELDEERARRELLSHRQIGTKRTELNWARGVTHYQLKEYKQALDILIANVVSPYRKDLRGIEYRVLAECADQLGDLQAAKEYRALQSKYKNK